MRRLSLTATIAVLTVLAILLSACGGGSTGSASGVTFAGYGGTGQEAETSAWFKSFTQETGITVAQDSPETWAKVQQMVQAGHVTWDVVQGGIQQGVTNNPQLEDIDCTVVNCKVFDGNAWPAYKQAVPLFAFSYVLTYNTNTFKDKTPPKSWADFFNPAIKGQRDVMPTSSGFEGLIEGALLSSGVPRDKLYPLDLDRAFGVIGKIKDQIVVMPTDDQCVNDVASGEAIMGTCYNGRVALAAQSDQPVEIAWGQQLQFVDYLYIPKGTPNLANAQKLIAHIVDHEGAIGNYIAYSGINPAGLDPASKWSKYLPSQNELKGDLAPIVPDQEYWNKNLSSMVEKVTKWAAA